MLRGVPAPPPNVLTPRARANAYPTFSDAAQHILDAAKQTPRPILAADALIGAAQTQTGLSDFGEAPLDIPLDLLCRSLTEEMELHALGALYAHRQLLGLLATRLRLVDLWKRHPEILTLPVERPIIIIGLPRSGTTILHKLLGQDPMRRRSPFWEQIMPLPIGDAPADAPDPRIALAQASIDTLYTLAPEFVQAHEITVGEPDEDILQLVHGFASKQFEWSYVVPTYVQWYRASDHTIGYQWFKRVLQTSQFLRPGSSRWVLKAPQHLEHLRALVTAFPDAILVQTHRDPTDAVISLANMTCCGQRRYFDHPNPHFIGRNMVDIVERLLRKGEDDRSNLTQTFIDLPFDEFRADQIGSVKRIYAAAGDTLSAEAEQCMSEWIVANRQNKHGKHEYAPEDVGLDIASLRSRFDFYRHRYAS
ncbi:MAG TPA: sulfotransferase [Caulobacterales bacterium]|nr:sulfotransferase [Caulobacterales bacterium]